METDPADLPIAGTIHESLGIRTLEVSSERVVMEMEVGPRVHQPFGLMHGGASAVLAESAASLGAYVASQPGSHALGIELNVSHLKAVRSGLVRAIARPLRIGRTVQVWGIEIRDGEGAAVASARCTLAIREARR